MAPNEWFETRGSTPEIRESRSDDILRHPQLRQNISVVPAKRAVKEPGGSWGAAAISRPPSRCGPTPTTLTLKLKLKLKPHQQRPPAYLSLNDSFTLFSGFIK